MAATVPRATAIAQERLFAFLSQDSEILCQELQSKTTCASVTLQRESVYCVWKTTTSLAPGTYHRRFAVDGKWQDNPECKLHVPSPFGTQNSVLKVSSNSTARSTRSNSFTPPDKPKAAKASTVSTGSFSGAQP